MANIKEAGGKVFQFLSFYCKISVFLECGITRDYPVTIFAIFVGAKQVDSNMNDRIISLKETHFCISGFLKI